MLSLHFTPSKGTLALLLWCKALFKMLAMHFCFEHNTLQSWCSSFGMAICTFAMIHHLLQPQLSLFFTVYINANSSLECMTWGTRKSTGWCLSKTSDYIWLFLLGRTLCKEVQRSSHSKTVPMPTSGSVSVDKGEVSASTSHSLPMSSFVD